MMVERTTYTETSRGQLVKNLNQATKKLTEINKNQTNISSKELQEVIQAWQQVNANFLKGKKIEPDEKMQKSIKQALEAIQLFYNQNPGANRAAQKNAEAVIASLFSNLLVELHTFDGNLEKHRIGLRVEKTGQSKQA